jgi:hypothetical protein
MKWFRRIFPTKEQKIFLDIAGKVFDDMCHGDGPVAEIYRQHPDVKGRVWKDIRNELEDIASAGAGERLMRRLRGKLAEYVQLLVTAKFYTNLEAADRELFAQHVIGSSREIQDQVYYLGLALDYAFVAILEFIIFEGWGGDQDSKKHLKEVQAGFMDECSAHCQFVMLVARGKSEGRELTDAEKENGKLTVTLREGLRRALAGEAILDKEVP